MKTVMDAVNEFKGEWHGNEDKVYICDAGVITDYDQFNDLVSQMETNFGKCPDYVIYDYKSNKKELLTPRPQKPVYTQAMADNGELPSVGMECDFIATFFTHEPSNTGTGTPIAYHENKVWFSTGSKEFVINLNVITFKPLTPPIKLEDGKAYQFAHKAGLDGLHGVYYDNKFYIGGDYVESDNCTNIQPLTVEVK
jgi:hypothetical protein